MARMVGYATHLPKDSTPHTHLRLGPETSSKLAIPTNKMRDGCPSTGSLSQYSYLEPAVGFQDSCESWLAGVLHTKELSSNTKSKKGGAIRNDVHEAIWDIESRLHDEEKNLKTKYEDVLHAKQKLECTWVSLDSCHCELDRLESLLAEACTESMSEEKALDEAYGSTVSQHHILSVALLPLRQLYRKLHLYAEDRTSLLQKAPSTLADCEEIQSLVIARVQKVEAILDNERMSDATLKAMMGDLSGLVSRLCSIDDNLQTLSKVVNLEALVQRMVDVDHFLNGARKRIMEQVQLSSVKMKDEEHKLKKLQGVVDYAKSLLPSAQLSILQLQEQFKQRKALLSAMDEWKCELKDMRKRLLKVVPETERESNRAWMTMEDLCDEVAQLQQVTKQQADLLEDAVMELGCRQKEMRSLRRLMKQAQRQQQNGKMKFRVGGCSENQDVHQLLVRGEEELQRGITLQEELRRHARQGVALLWAGVQLNTDWLTDDEELPDLCTTAYMPTPNLTEGKFGKSSSSLSPISEEEDRESLKKPREYADYFGTECMMMNPDYKAARHLLTDGMSASSGELERVDATDSSSDSMLTPCEMESSETNDSNEVQHEKAKIFDQVIGKVVIGDLTNPGYIEEDSGGEDTIVAGVRSIRIAHPRNGMDFESTVPVHDGVSTEMLKHIEYKMDVTARLKIPDIQSSPKVSVIGEKSNQKKEATVLTVNDKSLVQPGQVQLSYKNNKYDFFNPRRPEESCYQITKTSYIPTRSTHDVSVAQFRSLSGLLRTTEISSPLHYYIPTIPISSSNYTRFGHDRTQFHWDSQSMTNYTPFQSNFSPLNFQSQKPLLGMIRRPGTVPGVWQACVPGFANLHNGMHPSRFGQTHFH